MNASLSTTKSGQSRHDVRHTPSSCWLPAPEQVVRSQHQQLGGFRVHLPQVVHVVEAGTHAELHTARLLKEPTPDGNQNSVIEEGIHACKTGRCVCTCSVCNHQVRLSTISLWNVNIHCTHTNRNIPDLMVNSPQANHHYRLLYLTVLTVKSVHTNILFFLVMMAVAESLVDM